MNKHRLVCNMFECDFIKIKQKRLNWELGPQTDGSLSVDEPLRKVMSFRYLRSQTGEGDAQRDASE